MRKLRLELDALIVESFAPADGTGGRGTVHGHVSLYWEDCQYVSETCDGAGWPCGPTEQSCGGTCYEYTCHPGCGVTSNCWVDPSDPAITCNGMICIDMEG